MGFFIPCAMALGNSSFCPKLRSRSVWTTLLFFCSLIQSAVCQIRYTIPEELKRGSLIGNVAQDLGLDLQRLRSGRARILTRQSIQYTELKTDKGILVVNEKIDREKLCGDVTPCSFSFEVILENPMELHRLTVEITDINDNAPTFRKEEIKFEISESATLGSRFLLPSAEDADVGSNDIQKYILSTNDIFGLKQHSSPDGRKYAEMVLEKPLDRESEPRLSLKLIAVDGGAPHKSGTVKIEITVLDANDNPPIFNQTLYKAAVSEKALKGTYITAVNASDADSGSNCLITYRFSNMKEQLADVFHLDENTGIITLIGQVDYEKDKKHEVMVEATDKGGLTDSSKVMIEVLDENDNAPAINVMSFSSTVPEDAPVGTTVAIINVVDADSEQNGKIACTTDSSPPFKIKPTLTNYYALLTDAGFDRELVSHYNITVKATDSGAPALTSKTILH
ncbi:protocadherin beta-1-like [Takifugu flavidus]|uniref:protocadherin beta-1-like n=1 Tax=Takifugu flavidus TaxID=433684 RepID=UPI00254428F4|nr:protocadherin beta-1-like [Takifugu flavidus]